MTKTNHFRIIDALFRKPVDRTPVWLMRQAGRYLPEYRELRQRVPNFMDFCRTPELATQATLQPLARFDLDAAIIFSDILTVPAAMGMDLQFVEGKGPLMLNPIRCEHDVNALLEPDVNESLGYVMKAIQMVSNELAGKVPLIGFAGSPWTVACYMVEGQGSKLFKTTKTMLYQSPDLMHQLLNKVARMTIAYLNAQIQAGARIIMLFDTWGGILTRAAYQEFSLAYMRLIAQHLQRECHGESIPVVFFTKGAGTWLENLAESGCDAVGVDWTMDLGDARRRIGDRVALQGNLDPMCLFATPNRVSEEVQSILQSFGDHPGLVFNLGHGIDKDTPIESVAAMVETVHQHAGVKA